MDNCRSHVSRLTKTFLEANNINHFKTPAQSPDFNPIELVWNDMKEYISNVIKPKYIQE